MNLLLALTLAFQPSPQTTPGTGNAQAAATALASPRVQSAYAFLKTQVARIQDPLTRHETLDALTNPKTCIQSRANLTPDLRATIIRSLKSQNLLPPDDPGTLLFPPLLADSSACPQLPMPVYAAPGSSFHGHHSYPGGLMIHVMFNSLSAANFAAAYRQTYGPNLILQDDLLLAAPLWHDWAKAFVFQWNADGTEFTELNFGGPPESRTPAHHIFAIAEMMKRGLSPALVTTMASAHTAPTLGNEFKVVNWLRAAAILAQLDPIALHYLTPDGHLSQMLPEYTIHNLSDADFILAGPAIVEAERILAELAPRFGYTPSDPTSYNTRYRNRVLAAIPAERLTMLPPATAASEIAALLR